VEEVIIRRKERKKERKKEIVRKILSEQTSKWIQVYNEGKY
jgi:hypothetical protein